MNAAWSMVLASWLFATMGVGVKFASELYGTGEIVMYRGFVGALVLGFFARSRGVSLATTVPGMHFWRSFIGAVALALWFYAIGGLPLATGVTLNYMSSVWMAVFLIGGAIAVGSSRIDGRLFVTVLLGFAGVALVLKPTLGQDQLGAGLAGLLSGMLSALAYLQVAALSRAGEPELRIVFYFSIGSVVVGAAMALFGGGWHAHSVRGVALLIAIGLLAAIAQLFLTRAYAIGRPLANASLNYLGIVFSALYGLAVFGEPLSWTSVAGMALIIVAGVAATLLRAQKIRAHDLTPGGD